MYFIKLHVANPEHIGGSLDEAFHKMPGVVRYGVHEETRVIKENMLGMD